MRVWVTRDEEPDGPLCAALRARGLTPVLEPVLTRRVRNEALVELQQLRADDWLVLTSPYAIEAVAGEPAARAARVAVVGEPSARLARELGLRVELVGADGHGATLFAELAKRASTGRVCCPRSSLSKPREPWAEVELLQPVLYDTTPRAFDATVAGQVEVVAVASPSAVRAVCAQLGARAAALRYASIGRTTSAALREYGIEPWVEAATPGFEALAESIARARP